MKNVKQLILLAAVILLSGCVGEKLSIRENTDNKGLDIVSGEQLLIESIDAVYKLNGQEISSNSYAQKTINKSNTTDAFGKGTLYTITYTDEKLPTLVQKFYIYSGKDYLLTEFTLESNEDIAINYMAPVNYQGSLDILGTGDLRALFVPFDNDCWVRYQSHPLNFNELTSYEVTSVFNNDTRKALVIGSVEHDMWKTGIRMQTQGSKMHSIQCYGGVADSLTRDSKAHGFVKGKIVKSPKVLLGIFDDWRVGMDQYALANATVTPPKEWNKAMPFGWNSWGALQFRLNYQNAIEVSDFYKEYLQGNSFLNADSTVVIGLDSGWNSFTEEQLKSFVERCRANGQVAGIYWTPFTDWGRNPERDVHDAPGYKYKDIYIYANGQPQELDGAYAIDPTHPAIEQRMKTTSELFRRCGFEYVKMDFMTHGAMEADSWYNKDMQTGIQAYNYGMQLLNNYFGDMFINLSISPTFPAQYAQSRRIACDAWNQIKDTEYTMNAVSYGWWIDKVYQYNDADHVVLRDASEGENRARITSAVITGLYIAGDDFSTTGPEDSKERAKKYLTNAAINAIATGETFRPVEGNGERSECQFIREDAKGLYYVYFNYTDEEVSIKFPFERIGLGMNKTYKATELWSNKDVDIKSDITVSAKDVVVIRIN